jgi:hypothetical protein
MEDYKVRVEDYEVRVDGMETKSKRCKIELSRDHNNNGRMLVRIIVCKSTRLLLETTIPWARLKD